MDGGFVLVVDDDDDARILIAEIARLAGYKAVCVGSFLEAQSALRAQPAAVLLDMVMPDQLCIRVAAFMADEAPQLPTVLMSGSSADAIAAMRRKLAALGTNITAVLLKPFWVDELLEAMAATLPNASPETSFADADESGSEWQVSNGGSP